MSISNGSCTLRGVERDEPDDRPRRVVGRRRSARPATVCSPVAGTVDRRARRCRRAACRRARRRGRRPCPAATPSAVRMRVAELEHRVGRRVRGAAVVARLEADEVGDDDVAGHDLGVLVAEGLRARRTGPPATTCASSAARSSRRWVGVCVPNFSSRVRKSISGSAAALARRAAAGPAGHPPRQHRLLRLGDRHEVDVARAVRVDLGDARQLAERHPVVDRLSPTAGCGRTASASIVTSPVVGSATSLVRDEAGRQQRRRRRWPAARGGRAPPAGPPTAGAARPAAGRCPRRRAVAGVNVSSCVSINDLTVRMAWLAGLAIVALLLAGWRKTARAQPKGPRSPDRNPAPRARSR